MKLFSYLLLFISFSAFGQIQTNAPWINNVDFEGKSTELTINEIKQRADNYFNNIDTDKKGSGYKPYNRWLEHWKTYQTDNGTIMPASDLWKAWEIKKEMEHFSVQKNTTIESNWQSMGPFSFIDSGSWGKGQGRVNVIVVDPNNPNIYYVGTPAGGLWKSTDAGLSWIPLTDYLPQIGVSGIAIDPNNSNIIYITTGDDDARDSYFVGVMKSTDGGQTWTIAGTLPTSSYYTANEIYIDPSNSNRIWVATTTGLYLSINEGLTWTKKLSENVTDFKLKPGDSNTIYAVTASNYGVNIFSKFYKSTDGGSTFSQITTGLPSDSTRMTIDVSPANSDYVYVLSTYPKETVINNKTSIIQYAYKGVYKSTNSGVFFNKTLENDDLSNGSKQGYYDLALGVSDKDANEIYVGILNIWKSTDGGTDFQQINEWYLDDLPAYTHADIHFLRFYNGVLFAGTDGGIYRSSNNGVTFESLTTGLAIGQFYRISVSEKTSSNIVGGLQDNGGYVYSNNSWYNYHGADGMDAATNSVYKDISYSFIQFGGELYKSLAGESSFEVSAPVGEAGNWVTPLVSDNTGALYAGYSQLYKYFDGTWTKLSNHTFSGILNCIEIDPSDNKIIYVSSNRNLYKSIDGGSNFENLSISNLQGYEISSIEVNNHDSNIIYVTTSGTTGKVYKSIDGGLNWSDITYNLPSESKNVIRHQNYHNNNPIYVGTYLGVYYLDDTLSEWQLFSTNLPNVHVTDLEISPIDGVITASTYGRGIWRSVIPISKPEYDIMAYDVSTTNSIVFCDDFSINISVKNIGSNDITKVYIDYDIDNNSYSETWEGTINPDEITIIPVAIKYHKGKHLISYTVSTDNDAYSDNNTGSILVNFNEFDDTPTEVNEFEDLITDSWTVYTQRAEEDHLWSIDVPSNEGGYKLSTVSSGTKAYMTNPTGDYTNQTLSLLYTPCYDLTQVLNPIMKFQMAFDIEPDWDVLYVEYSTDNGITWDVLGTADDPNWYNSTANENELTIGKQWTGSDTTLKEYSYDLDAFTNEPQISFRFHFESDDFVTANGVLIDDFVIAGEQLAIEDININTAKIFPNPTTDLVNISWNETYNGELKLFDITGRLLKIIQVKNKSQISFTTDYLSTGVYLLQFSNDNHHLVKKLIIER